MAIAYDGADWEFSGSGGSVSHTVDTVITMNTGISVPSTLGGKEIVISADGLYICAEVISSSSGARTITVYDPGSEVYEALTGDGSQDFVVYNFDKYTTGGTWTSVSYDGGTGETTLTMTGASFPTFARYRIK